MVTGRESIPRIRSVGGADRLAFERLVDRYYERVWRTVRARMGPWLRGLESVEDLVQETFLAAMRDLDRYDLRGDRECVAWLARLAEHRIRNAVRYHRALRRDRLREVRASVVRISGASSRRGWVPLARTPSPPDRAAHGELRRELGMALRALPKGERRLVLLRKQGEATWAELARRVRTAERRGGPKAARSGSRAPRQHATKATRVTEYQRQVALLRGIHVGGRNRLAMADLRALLEGLGCREVKTLIQSGNAVFDIAASRAAELATDLAAEIEERHGLRVPVLTRSAERFRRAAAHHPLAGAGVEEKRLHMLFLASLPTPKQARALDPKRYAPDRFVLNGRELYLDFPNGAARTKLTTATIDRTLGTITTGRNWRTVRRIAELTRHA